MFRNKRKHIDGSYGSNNKVNKQISKGEEGEAFSQRIECTPAPEQELRSTTMNIEMANALSLSRPCFCSLKP